MSVSGRCIQYLKLYTLIPSRRILSEARCGFVYGEPIKSAFQILKLHLGKGGRKPPVASLHTRMSGTTASECCP